MVAFDRQSFKHNVWQAVVNIPPGTTVSYGQIATMAGHPRHARFVGAVLSNLPQDTKLPWHRVVNAQGRIAFADGSEQFIEQKRRLEEEGVVFLRGRVMAAKEN